MLIADDLDKLLSILPDFIKIPLRSHPNKKFLIEVVMDLGRRPEARFPDGPQYLSMNRISWCDLDLCIKKIPRFSGDNRSGIESTLHRISSIRNRKGNVVGLTFRVGRAIFGTISVIRDLLYANKSILLLGKPGVGKTTAIREITRVLADEMEKRVVIIDTSNEIAGDGDIPHPAIGRARRMQVSKPELQYQVMIEAVENHMPEVIIIDEIGTELEALAARTIAERGVQLVGTAHGNSLDNLIKNPTLSDLVGGIQYVTLGDDEAKRRGSQKSILERKTLPAFQVAIEIHERSDWIIHEKVDETVDKILQGSLTFLQRRKLNGDGSIAIQMESLNSLDLMLYDTFYAQDVIKSNFYSENFSSVKDNNFINLSSNFASNLKNFDNKSIQRGTYSYSLKLYTLYIYGLNLQQVESSIKHLNLSLILTRDLFKADYILGLKSSIKYSSKIRQVAKLKKIIIYTINTSSISSINRALKKISTVKSNILDNWFRLSVDKEGIELDAIIEVRYAIEKIVLKSMESVILLPRNDSIRDLQLKLINLYNLKYSTFSKNTSQQLIVYPNN
uniref:AAA+ ATPase domain-containing protein n=1 Tax=Polysiphonia elongata TaxID=159753 RepID=A0A1Z1MBJ3_9FLOR|nr:hypothetical protein [Polysiphonia elongata]ARW63346.1 hypothetical protein [Polysiphonia elongata]